MTQLGVAAQPAATGTPLLEARHLTKHFPVHRTVSPRRSGGRRGLGGVRRPGEASDRSRDVVHAVEDVSLALAEARVTAVVGESGSGKSTLAQAAVRLLTVDEGYVNYRGENLASARGGALKDFRRSVQMVFQDTGSSLTPPNTPLSTERVRMRVS